MPEFLPTNGDPHHALEGGLYKMKNPAPQAKSAHTNTHAHTYLIILAQRISLHSIPQCRGMKSAKPQNHSKPLRSSSFIVHQCS